MPVNIAAALGLTVGLTRMSAEGCQRITETAVVAPGLPTDRVRGRQCVPQCSLGAMGGRDDADLDNALASATDLRTASIRAFAANASQPTKGHDSSSVAECWHHPPTPRRV